MSKALSGNGLDNRQLERRKQKRTSIGHSKNTRVKHKRRKHLKHFGKVKV